MPRPVRDRVVNLLNEQGPLTWGEIHERLDRVSEKRLESTIDAMLVDDMLVFGDGGYDLTEKVRGRG